MAEAPYGETPQRIGILTGGGDAPGLNAVIRAAVKSAFNHGCETIGLEDSFAGLIDRGRTRRLTLADVTSIIRQGGTILGTTNRGNPFAYPVDSAGGVEDVSARCLGRFGELGLEALIVIGGDGTLAIAHKFYERGLPVVGVPKTIDNDIVETTNTFGFDSAVAFATEAIDRLHTTAESHRRIMVVEVMGRYAGWIALHAGMAGGADVILIPEIPFAIEAVAERLRTRERLGARFSIVVVAEGAVPVGGTASVIQAGRPGVAERLGGMGGHVAARLQELTGKETRCVVLGHLQRGGPPTSFDRVLATRFGARAMELVLERRFGHMVAYHPPDIVAVPLDRVVGRTRQVAVSSDMLRAARSVGIVFGD